MRRGPLFLVVAMSGAGVLTIEILGTRLLGPFYGVSLFLWSALISVTLAALSVGYALGGRWADRGPSAGKLALMLVAAGVWTMLVPWARAPLLALADRLDLRLGVLVAATVLFFPPLVLLGMVSPYAIRLRADRLEQVGRTAGDLYAVSTVASVAAALLTGFWLIPRVGVTRLAAGTGLMLVVAALIAWLAARPRGARVAAWVVAALGLGAWRVAQPDAPVGADVRFAGQSPYADIRVVDRGELRYLLIDGGIHTIVKPGTPQAHHAYVHVAELAKELFPQPGDLLLVGLGGGSAARAYARDGWRVDAVELDSLVVRVAFEHFGFKRSDAHVIVGDGRRFLAGSRRRYDVIFFDAFGSSSIPFHLVTREAFGLAHARLRPGGVLVLNVEAVGWRDPLVEGLGATLRATFSQVVALPIAEPPDRIGNVVLLASDRPLEISDAALGNPVDYVTDPYLHWTVLLRNHAWENRFEPGQGAAIVTDDLNPADVWAERINLVARRDLHRQFGNDATGW